jgi:hypothetical protein
MRSELVRKVVLFFIYFLISTSLTARNNSYLWLSKEKGDMTIVRLINPPPGYVRDIAIEGSFGDWLRNLPLKEGHPPVHLYDGSLKRNQKAHYAVLDIDTGSRDLQQCADAVIRLRGEYLYSIGHFRQICFNFTSGDTASFAKWIDGYRPIVLGNNVSWKRSAAIDSSYSTFRQYLDTIFQYAGTHSLKKELEKIDIANAIRPGDIFIKGGFPGRGSGHAAIVLDVASDSTGRQKAFLLAQGYMPAQEIHVLKNPDDSSLSPWYEMDISKPLQTPEWTFEYSELMRFK